MNDADAYINRIIYQQDPNFSNTKLSILDYYLQEKLKLPDAQKIYDYFYYNLIYIEKLLADQPSEVFLKHMLLYTFIYNTDYFVIDLLAYVDEGTIKLNRVENFIRSVYQTITQYIDGIIALLDDGIPTPATDYSDIATAYELARNDEADKINYYKEKLDIAIAQLPVDNLGSDYPDILNIILNTHLDNLYNWPKEYQQNAAGDVVIIAMPDENLLTYQETFMNLMSQIALSKGSTSIKHSTKSVNRQSQYKSMNKSSESLSKHRENFGKTNILNRTLKLNNRRGLSAVSEGGKRRKKTRKQKRKQKKSRRRRN
jgi:hypothetical protein